MSHKVALCWFVRGNARFSGETARLDIAIGEIEDVLDILPAQPLDAEQMPVRERPRHQSVLSRSTTRSAAAPSSLSATLTDSRRVVCTLVPT